MPRMQQPVYKRFVAAIIGSKKAVAVIATIIFVFLKPYLAKINVVVTQEEMVIVVGLAGTYVLGQGVADMGKGKAQFEAAQAVPPTGAAGSSPPVPVPLPLPPEENV